MFVVMLIIGPTDECMRPAYSKRNWLDVRMAALHVAVIIRKCHAVRASRRSRETEAKQRR